MLDLRNKVGKLRNKFPEIKFLGPAIPGKINEIENILGFKLTPEFKAVSLFLFILCGKKHSSLISMNPYSISECFTLSQDACTYTLDKACELFKTKQLKFRYLKKSLHSVINITQKCFCFSNWGR